MELRSQKWSGPERDPTQCSALLPLRSTSPVADKIPVNSSIGLYARATAPKRPVHGTPRRTEPVTAHAHGRGTAQKFFRNLHTHFNVRDWPMRLRCNGFLKSVRTPVERCVCERLPIKRKSRMLTRMISSQYPRFLRPGAMVIGCSPCFQAGRSVRWVAALAERNPLNVFASLRNFHSYPCANSLKRAESARISPGSG